MDVLIVVTDDIMIVSQFGGIIMKWKSFTPEEFLTLRKNPYTLRISEKTKAFIRVFKEQFWSGLQEGKSKFEILQEMDMTPRYLAYPE